ncbi:T9SS type A sorting domain-containing protein [bacterium]|nr:T9SS type A sorting domain-containing protein [bacterium]MBU1984160.1 T9SS type A sorting domain-containing protein [bacterium]
MTRQVCESVVIGCAVCLLLCCGIVEGSVRQVPGEYPTIQAALDASASGDTVRVAPGPYYEAVRFPAADVRLWGEFVFTGDSADLQSTIIDASPFAGQDTAACLTFIHPNSPAAEVAGFVLRGGTGVSESGVYGRGGGVFMQNASPTLRSNIITQNTAYAAAISSEIGEPRVLHCSIYDNYCVAGALCLFTEYIAPVWRFAFDWNELGDNPGDGGPFIALYRVSGTFNHNRFRLPQTPVTLVVQILDSFRDSMEFCGNVFEDIHTDPNFSVPFVAFDESVHLIQDNVFRDCTLNFFALDLARARFRPRQTIRRNLFQNIRCESQLGSGIFIQSPNALIEDNVFENCAGGAQGALWATADADSGFNLLIQHNRFIGNRISLVNYTGIVHIYPYSRRPDRLPVLVNNWFEGNGPIAVGQDNPSVIWDASGNYWGDSTGPYHPTENPNGRGDTAAFNVHVTPWLTEPPQSGIDSEPSWAGIPEKWELLPVHPNPFNATLTVRIEAATTVPLQVTIFDIQGRRVKDLWRGMIPTNGEVTLKWDGGTEYGAAASGVYFVMATSKGRHPTAQTRKAVLLR